jgi:hypothetical protein
MVRRIWLGSGMRRALLCCTETELRWVLVQAEEYLPLLNRGQKHSAERVEIEDWARIVLHEIQRRQLDAMIEDRRRRID